jgi:AraC family transcriptional regulator
MAHQHSSRHAHADVRSVAVQVPGFVLREAYYPPMSSVQRHAHDNILWGFVISGEMVDETSASCDLCRPMTIRALPAGHAHANRCGPNGARCLLIEPSPEVIRRAETLRTRSRTAFKTVRHVGAGRFSELGLRLWHEVRRPDALSALAAECILSEMVGCVANPQTTSWGARPAWLDRVCQRLHDLYRDEQELATLAQDADVHPVHLVRVFRRFCGVTPADYVRRLRVTWVCDALRTDTVGIADIAYAAGFYDQSHLNRVFRRERGMTPAQYRTSRRSEGHRVATAHAS